MDGEVGCRVEALWVFICGGEIRAVTPKEPHRLTSFTRFTGSVTLSND